MNDRERDLRFTLICICGCVACHLQGVGWVAPQVHHLNFGDKHGGKRLGDDHTIGLCPWHHVGELVFEWSKGMHRKRLGPSWHHEASAFRETYGSGEELLEFQNALIAAYVARTAAAELEEA